MLEEVWGRRCSEGVLLQRLFVKWNVVFEPWKLEEGFMIRFPPGSGV